MSLGNNLPKGMSIPELPEEQKPSFLTLADVNYAGMIRQALADLPLEVQITKCLVVEEDGRFSEVQLEIQVLGEKECCYKVGGTE